MSLTLARDASACSLCRRYAPYDCSVAEWRNLNNIRHLTTAKGGASPQGDGEKADRDLSTTLEVTKSIEI
ncbi:MAG: hypothetical protein K2K85_02865 [Clostridia bacterium]|nr:hypothetical protein [Clostridia bacterium]